MKRAFVENEMSYRFETEKISQHVVKYNVDIRPPILPESGLAELRDYGNWLTGQFPRLYETVVSGPRQLRILRALVLPNGVRIEVPTFVLLSHGPVFHFPLRLYLGRSYKLDLPDKNETLRRALQELRARLVGRAVPRVMINHEIVFDTAEVDSLGIVASNLQKSSWRAAQNLRIHMQSPVEDKNVDIAVWPTRLQPMGRPGAAAAGEKGQFGVVVHVDISRQKAVPDVGETELSAFLSFADDYISGRLIRFLNDEL